MRCDLKRFEVSAAKHEDATAKEAMWKVFIHVRFASDDPANWGELRAYGGSWVRTLNRTHAQKDFLGGDPELDSTLKHNPRKHEVVTQLETSTSLPFWGDVQGPKKKNDLEWRLGNDQHIEIFYAKQVKGVPRSMPKSRHFLKDDDNKPDVLAKTDRPHEIDLKKWHVVGRDEPSFSPFQLGDYVEYWHHGEFHIRVPSTTKVVARRRLHCRVHGTYPKYEYTYYVQ